MISGGDKAFILIILIIATAYVGDSYITLLQYKAESAREINLKKAETTNQNKLIQGLIEKGLNSN